MSYGWHMSKYEFLNWLCFNYTWKLPVWLSCVSIQKCSIKVSLRVYIVEEHSQILDIENKKMERLIRWKITLLLGAWSFIEERLRGLVLARSVFCCNSAFRLTCRNNEVGGSQGKWSWSLGQYAAWSKSKIRCFLWQLEVTVHLCWFSDMSSEFE